MTSPSNAWQDALSKLFHKVRLDEPMGRHTTFRIGGPADAYVEASSLEELATLYSFARERALPVFLLGWGSNLLVQDRGIRGIVLRLCGEFEAMEFEPLHPLLPSLLPGAGEPQGPRVRVGAGARLSVWGGACAQRAMAGAESLAGIPGTVGGALVMNAGTRECEIGSLVRGVRLFDLERLAPEWLSRDRCGFGYRRSSLGDRVVLGAELELKKGSKVDILTHVRELQKKRRQTQPISTYTVGSTFKNPTGLFAAKLIEEAGLKGFRCGGVKVSGKHANFFENDARATAKDVLALVGTVREKVRERFGVELELEMKVVGEA